MYEQDHGLGWVGLGFVNWTHEHVCFISKFADYCAARIVYTAESM